jgi:hypothetical protein
MGHRNPTGVSHLESKIRISNSPRFWRLLDHGNACKISFLTSHHSNSFFLRIDVVESINAILRPKNRDWLNINNLIINKVPENLKTYKSID